MNKRKIYLILAVAIALIAVFVGGRFYLHHRIDYFLKDKLEAKLGVEYTIDYSKSSFSIFNGDFALTDIVFSKINRKDTSWFISADEAEIIGFDLIKFIGSGKFLVDSLVLIDPLVELKNLPQAKKMDRKDVKDLEIDVQTLFCKKGSFNYNPRGPEQLKCNFSFNINSFDFKSVIIGFEELWRKSDFTATNCTYLLPDSIYYLTASKISLPKDSSHVEIDSLSIKSTLSRSDYPKYYGWQKSRFTADVEKIKISRPKNVSDSLLVLDGIEIFGLHLKIDKDSRYPLPDRVTELPQLALQQMSQKIKIDTVNIHNSRFAFSSIFGDNTHNELMFNNVEGALTGLQNVDTTKSAFKLEARSDLMNEASLALKLEYAYGPEQPFECSAYLGNTNLPFMSSFLQSAAGIKIETGKVDELEMIMSGNTHGQWGYVKFVYSDLKLHAVDKESGKDLWLVNTIADVAGGLVFWKSNPENNNFRQGNFSGSRNKAKGFASQWIDGLMEGVLETVSKISPRKVRQISKKN